jgi:hypothetical protein
LLYCWEDSLEVHLLLAYLGTLMGTNKSLSLRSTNFLTSDTSTRHQTGGNYFSRETILFSTHISFPILFQTETTLSLDSSMCTETGYRWMGQTRFQEEEISLFLRCVRTGSVVNPTRHLMDTRGYLTERKAAVTWIWPLISTLCQD